MNMFSVDASDALKGSCIHDIFAVYKPNKDIENMELITNILANYGFPNVTDGQKAKIIQSIQWLYEYLNKNYAPVTHIERECPLLYPLPTGQILRGEIDMIWYYMEDGKEKCVLIDYKTFPGKSSEIETHTEKYYAQLSAYHSALTASGVIVTDTLIYYPVQAHLRKLLK
jgi:ATP-dependent exoDNAse (exonuclease V) beta subunit